jgi:hypothetical protein
VEVFGDTDVYEAAPPTDATILLRGIVLKGMNPTDEPADYEKKSKGGAVQKVNDPAMPVAWSREVKNEAGTTNKVLTTTMGAATDLVDPVPLSLQAGSHNAHLASIDTAASSGQDEITTLTTGRLFLQQRAFDRAWLHPSTQAHRAAVRQFQT